MGKKDRNNRMHVFCPVCNTELSTRNMFPKCSHCGVSLKIEMTSPRTVIDRRNGIKTEMVKSQPVAKLRKAALSGAAS